MTYKILALFIATLTGSVHCGSMCGGLSLSIGNAPTRQAAYQVARLFSYALLGVLCGWGGAFLLQGDLFEWMTAISAFLLASYLVISGLYLFFKGRPIEIGNTILAPFRPLLMGRFFSNGIGAFTPIQRALVTGFFTPLLPCAWLMTAVILAVNSGSPLFGAALFFAVWLGSLPVLLAGPAILRVFADGFHRKGRKAVAVLMVLAGVFSIYQRVSGAHGFGDSRVHSAHESGSSQLICE